MAPPHLQLFQSVGSFPYPAVFAAAHTGLATFLNFSNHDDDEGDEPQGVVHLQPPADAVDPLCFLPVEMYMHVK